MRMGCLPSLVNSPWRIPADLRSEAWADRVIAAIQSDATKFGLDRRRAPAIAWLMRQFYATRLSWHRTVGTMDNAQRLVDQLLALAKRLTQLYPEQAAPYMLLSDGYIHRAKNAFRVPGEPVKEWNRNALDAAIQAVILDPESDEAHSLVKERRLRVNRLVSRLVP